MTEDITLRWKELEEKIAGEYGKKPDLNAFLLLIGIRELGKVKEKFTKEEKVALMHIAVCKLLSQSGYYELEGTDQDGWPHWKLVKNPPFINIFEQEVYLRQHIIEYFDAM
ncbi:MAG: hypothetical protein F9K23_05585 [Bacteroidetes bacterium]|nr:MAG: hypothetical protein F9K23_05585 [Bacteroidota bacterium]